MARLRMGRCFLFRYCGNPYLLRHFHMFHGPNSQESLIISIKYSSKESQMLGAIL
jgi:hypothetical protein